MEKGEQKGWALEQAAGATVRACFGCGSAEHILRDCPNRARQVHKVTSEEPELLFIGHTDAIVVEDGWKKVANHGCCRGKFDTAKPP